MKALVTIAIASLLAGSAVAQNYIPSEAEKKAALLLGYRLNGNSMNGMGRMIDLTDPKVLEEAAEMQATEVPREPPAAPIGPEAKLAQPVPLPVPRPDIATLFEEPVKASIRDRARAGNVCERHGMKKVVTKGGKSWRCR